MRDNVNFHIIFRNACLHTAVATVKNYYYFSAFRFVVKLILFMQL